jgi:hypothetical protein
MAKIEQQAICYQLLGLMGNFVSEKVLTCQGVQPSCKIKLHLFLTGANAEKSIIDL